MQTKAPVKKPTYTASKTALSRNELLPLMFEMGRLLKREICREGVDMSVSSFLHVETLRYIEEQKTPSMREIAEYLKIAPPSATALINTFVKEGILERAPDATDRRVVRMQLSAKGRKTLQETMRQRAEAFSRVVAHLSDHDCEELIRILAIVTRTPFTNHVYTK